MNSFTSFNEICRQEFCNCYSKTNIHLSSIDFMLRGMFLQTYSYFCIVVHLCSLNLDVLILFSNTHAMSVTFPQTQTENADYDFHDLVFLTTGVRRRGLWPSSERRLCFSHMSKKYFLGKEIKYLFTENSSMFILDWSSISIPSVATGTLKVI